MFPPASTRILSIAALAGAALIAYPDAAAAADALASLPAPAPNGLRVYLVRHGQALSNLDPEPDLPPEQLDHLTELGKQQAERTGAALAGRGVREVVTSPASRAQETAERVARAIGAAAPRVEPRLRPLDLGRGPDGKSLDWDARIAEWEAGRDPEPAGGESMAALGDRVAGLLAALAADAGKGPAAAGGRSLVLVAHGEVIAAYLGRLRGTAAPKRYPPGIKNASVTVVDLTPEGALERLSNHDPAAP